MLVQALHLVMRLLELSSKPIQLDLQHSLVFKLVTGQMVETLQESPLLVQQRLNILLD